MKNFKNKKFDLFFKMLIRFLHSQSHTHFDHKTFIKKTYVFMNIRIIFIISTRILTACSSKKKILEKQLQAVI